MGRILLVVAVLGALLVPSGAGATGFGPTTSPLSEPPPPTPSQVLSAVPSFNKLTVFGPAGSVQVPTSGTVDNANIALASNARGDGLIAWTENSGATHKAVALFWPAGASSGSVVARELLSGGTVSAVGPYAVLDPAGSATVVWSQNNQLQQVTTADAGGADPWGAPTQLPGGGGFGASLPDGRAVYGYLAGHLVGGKQWFDAVATTRTAGQPFRPVTFLLGDGGNVAPPPRFASSIFPATRVAISPAGRALVAYVATDNGDAMPTPCDPYNRAVTVALTTVTPGTEPASFTQGVVSADGDPDPQRLGFAAAGSDDRLAVSWEEVTGGCWNTPNRPLRQMAAYTAPGKTGMTATGPGVPGAPSVFKGMYWKTDGQLLFWTQTSAPIVNSQTLFDTGVPLTPVVPGPAPAPAPGPAPSPVGPVSPTPAPAVTAKVIRTAFVVSSNGTVKMTVDLTAPGNLEVALYVKKSGLLAAAKTVRVVSLKRKVAKAGKLRLTLALRGKAQKTLAKKGRLAVSVVTTFTPSAKGASKIKRTQSVTFKRKRR